MAATDPNSVHLGVSCLIDLNQAFQYLNKTLESRYGLSIIQWSLLQNLRQMPAVSPRVLSKTLGVTPGTLSLALARMERRELLFMCDDPSDARKKMISLTRDGKILLDAVDHEYEKLFLEIGKIHEKMSAVGTFLKGVLTSSDLTVPEVEESEI